MKQLHHRILGDGPPALLLHGLFGSHDNLLGLGRALAPQYTVILPDLRNHGQSFHTPEMDYSSMTADLKALLDELGVGPAHVIGHSMGGKAGMWLSLTAPSTVRSLSVLDIAPRRYEQRHLHIIQTLRAVAPESYHSRQELRQALAARIPQPDVVAFLLKSARMLPDGTFAWRLNTSALEENYAAISDFPERGGTYFGPTLFLKGALSDFILPGDEPRIRELFPSVLIKEIAGADHWIHADAPAAVAESVLLFLRGIA